MPTITGHRSAITGALATAGVPGIGTNEEISSLEEMEHILQAGTWASPNTFLKYYYKDSVISSSGLHKICPVVAAQHVVVP